jgi:hypothetical protein
MHYTLDAKLFLQPQSVLHSEHCVSVTKKNFLARSAYLTENKIHDKITVVAESFRKGESHKQHNSTTMS